MANYGKYYIAVRLLLLKQYLEANAGRTRIVKRSELEQLLEEHDMPVEKKTLYADFAALGDICGLQLEYDPHKKGYRLLNPPFEPYELRLLVDSVQSSKFITREKAREITAKPKKFAEKDSVKPCTKSIGSVQGFLWKYSNTDSRHRGCGSGFLQAQFSLPGAAWSSAVREALLLLRRRRRVRLGVSSGSAFSARRA